VSGDPVLEMGVWVWDNPIMTVIADDKKRVVLATVKPGDRFDVQQSNGKIVLTPLVEKEVPLVKARKVNGRWVGADVKMDRQLTVDSIRQDRER
jgi:hypothetical protein